MNILNRIPAAGILLMVLVSAMNFSALADEKSRPVIMIERAREKRNVVAPRATTTLAKETLAKGDARLALAQSLLAEGKEGQSLEESTKALEEYLRAGRIARDAELEREFREESADLLEEAAALSLRAKGNRSAPGYSKAVYNGDENLKAARRSHEIRFYNQAIRHSKNAMNWYRAIIGE